MNTTQFANNTIESLQGINSRTDIQSRKKKTLEDYEFVVDESRSLKTSTLGAGAYGTVKRAKDKQTGEIVAMKIMNKQNIFRYSSKENLKREISIQKKLVHPHVINLYHHFEDRENVYIVLEYAENGSLFEYIRKQKKCSEKEAFIYFFQTALGLHYLHKKDIIHRDLKPENLLLDKTGNVKLCDFGWSAEAKNQSRQTFCGTVDYMAPEMIKNLPYDHRIDIWSLGVLLYELLHGHAPFKGKSDQEKLNTITKNSTITFDPSISQEACDLIKKILKPVPIDRLSMEDILRHPWMKKFEKIYNIDILSYIEEDCNIRELSPFAEQRRESPKGSLADIKAGGNRKGSIELNRGGSRDRISKPKIITLFDDSMPLALDKKMRKDSKTGSSIRDGPLKSRLSTKESETGCSQPNSAGLINIQQLLKEYRGDSFQRNDVIKNTDSSLHSDSEYGQSKISIDDDKYNLKISNNGEDRNFDRHRGRGRAESSLFMEENFKRFNSVDRSNGMRDCKKLPSGNKHFSHISKSSMCEGDRNIRGILEAKALNKIYKRNMEIDRKLRDKKDNKEPNFFEKILMGLGCITRENKMSV